MNEDILQVYRPRIQRHIVNNLRFLFPEHNDQDDNFIVELAVVQYHDARFQEIKERREKINR